MNLTYPQGAQIVRRIEEECSVKSEGIPDLNLQRINPHNVCDSKGKLTTTVVLPLNIKLQVEY